MKKIILLSLALVISFGAMADKTPKVRKSMKEFKSMEEVDYIAVPMFIVRWFLPKEMKPYKKLLRQIKNVGVLSYDGPSVKLTTKIEDKMKTILDSKKMKILVEIHDDGEHIQVMAKMKNNKIKEIFIFVKEESEISLIHIKSRIKLNKIGKQLNDLLKDKKMLKDIFN